MKQIIRLLYNTTAIVFLLAFKISLFGQIFDSDLSINDSTQLHLLETIHDDFFVGKTISIKNTDVLFKTNSQDTLHLKIAEIRHLSVYDGTIPKSKTKKAGNEKSNTQEISATKSHSNSKKKSIRKKSPYPIVPNLNHVFFSPSGFNLRRDEANYRSFWGIANSLSYGITDNISIGGDISSLILMSMVSVKIKGTINITKNIHIGAGVRLHGIKELGETLKSYTSYYSTLSLGNEKRFFNIAAGAIDDGKKATPYYTVGASVQMGKRWRFLADSFIREKTIDAYSMIFVGVSFLKRKFHWDLGINYSFNDEMDFGFTPILSYGCLIYKHPISEPIKTKL